MSAANHLSAIRAILTATVWSFLVVFFVRTLDRIPATEDWQGAMTPPTALATCGFTALFAAVTWLRTVRWRGLLSLELCATARLYWVFSWAFLVNVIIPFRMGEMFRPIWVRRHGGSFADAVGTVLSERLADMTVLVGMLVLAAHAAPGGTIELFDNIPESIANQAAPILLAALMGLHLALTASAEHLSRRLSGGRGRPVAWCRNLLSGLERAASTPAYLRLMGLTCLIWAALVAGHLGVLATLFSDLHWSAAVMVPAATNLAGLLWVSPGNIGLYEAAVVFVLTAYGIAPEPALVAAVVLHVAVLTPTVILGLMGRWDMIRGTGGPADRA